MEWRPLQRRPLTKNWEGRQGREVAQKSPAPSLSRHPGTKAPWRGAGTMPCARQNSLARGMPNETGLVIHARGREASTFHLLVVLAPVQGCQPTKGHQTTTNPGGAIATSYGEAPATIRAQSRASGLSTICGEVAATTRAQSRASGLPTIFRETGPTLATLRLEDGPFPISGFTNSMISRFAITHFKTLDEPSLHSGSLSRHWFQH